MLVTLTRLWYNDVAKHAFIAVCCKMLFSLSIFKSGVMLLWCMLRMHKHTDAVDLACVLLHGSAIACPLDG